MIVRVPLDQLKATSPATPPAPRSAPAAYRGAALDLVIGALSQPFPNRIYSLRGELQRALLLYVGFTPSLPPEYDVEGLLRDAVGWKEQGNKNMFEILARVKTHGFKDNMNVYEYETARNAYAHRGISYKLITPFYERSDIKRISRPEDKFKRVLKRSKPSAKDSILEDSNLTAYTDAELRELGKKLPDEREFTSEDLQELQDLQ